MFGQCMFVAHGGGGGGGCLEKENTTLLKWLGIGNDGGGMFWTCFGALLNQTLTLAPNVYRVPPKKIKKKKKKNRTANVDQNTDTMR